MAQFDETPLVLMASSNYHCHESGDLLAHWNNHISLEIQSSYTIIENYILLKIISNQCDFHV